MTYRKVNIGIIGLGQIGSRLYKEILAKKKDISIKTGISVNIMALSAKSINKKRGFKFNKKIFYKNPLEIAKNPKKVTGEIALEILPIIGALIHFGRFIAEARADAKKGKLKKTVTIDGCSSCFTFWFDRGEILQIIGNDVTLEYKGAEVKIAPPGTSPSLNAVTAYKAEDSD